MNLLFGALPADMKGAANRQGAVLVVQFIKPSLAVKPCL